MRGDDGSSTRSDIVEEALRTTEHAERDGTTLRLLGGVAIRLRAGGDGLVVHPLALGADLRGRRS
jgi:hypothetical protein